MAGPSMESLTRMGLTERTGENTEILTLRDEAKRKELQESQDDIPPEENIFCTNPVL